MPKLKSGTLISYKMKIPPLYLDLLRAMQAEDGESVATHARRAIARYVGLEGEILDRLNRPISKEAAKHLKKAKSRPNFRAPISPGEVARRKKAIIKGRRARDTDVVLDPSTTGLDDEIRIPLETAKAIWALMPDDPGRDTDEAIARRIAPKVGLGVLPVMEFMNLISVDESLQRRMEG